MTTIMVVEDDSELLQVLLINLQVSLFDTQAVRSGREALALARGAAPDAIILDLSVPDVRGTELIAQLRGGYLAPLIVLSGRTGAGDKISALDAGADDYVTKPFAMDELLARLRAALRRDERIAAHGHSPRPVIGCWQVDVAAHQVTRADGTDEGAERLRLTPTEWAILEMLLQRPGQLVSSAQLLTRVWGPTFRSHTHYLRFHMARLRRKLEDDPGHPRCLLTEPGMGYRYQPAGPARDSGPRQRFSRSA